MEPLDHLTNAMSEANSLAALGVATLVCVLATGFAFALAVASRRRARDAREAVDGGAELREHATIVVGIAEVEGEAAVRVLLRETGKAWKHKGRWHHRWTEVEREVEARPFWVVTSKHERVLVEPGKNVFLVDRMDVTARRGDASRERTAALTNGERVAVTGRLVQRSGGGGGAYREGPAQWVMEPPARGPMVIATEPMADRHANWSTFYLRAALVPIALLVATHVLAYPIFSAFLVDGQSTIGRVRDHETYVTRGRHGTTRHYQIEIERDADPVWMTVSSDGYERAIDGAEVWLVRRPNGDVILGREPGLDPALVLVAVICLLFALGIVSGLASRRKLWWEQRRVVTNGSGPL